MKVLDKRKKRRQMVVLCSKSCKTNVKHLRQPTQPCKLNSRKRPRSPQERLQRREVQECEPRETYSDAWKKKNVRKSSMISIVKWILWKLHPTWQTNLGRWMQTNSCQVMSWTDAEWSIRMWGRISVRRIRPPNKKPSLPKWRLWSLKCKFGSKSVAIRMNSWLSRPEMLNLCTNKVLKREQIS